MFDALTPVNVRRRELKGETIFERWTKLGAVPYGGNKSPVIVFNDWREALVGIAAHEFHHIRQFQNKARCVEAYCERAAAEALARYRAQKGPGE